MTITLTNLGNAYGALGDHAKKRDMLERALAIKERACRAPSRDHPEVAIRAGEPRERVRHIRRPREEARHAGARARDRRAGVRPRPPASGRHVPLGSKTARLGDDAKKRDMLERALAIKERAYGRAPS